MKRLKDVYNLVEMITLWGKLLNGFEHGSYGSGDINTLAKRCLFKHGEKPISPLVEGYIEYDMFEGQDEVSEGILELYKDKWEKSYEALTVEYNPIENYDRKEDTIIENSGTNTDTFGAQTNTIGQQNITIGSKEDTLGQKTYTEGQRVDQYGNKSNTNGQRTDSHSAQTNTEGAHNDIDTHSVAPYDTSTVKVESSDSHNMASKTNTQGAFTVTTGEQTFTEGAHSDTKGQQINTESAQTNTYGSQTNTNGQRIDTVASHEDTHEIDTQTLTSGYIHGNIGVTTNQQMITSEIEMRNKLLFWKIVTDDVIHELTLKIYG